MEQRLDPSTVDAEQLEDQQSEVGEIGREHDLALIVGDETARASMRYQLAARDPPS
jgi:hypothetical protein